jgi:hypothetical protein
MIGATVCPKCGTTMDEEPKVGVPQEFSADKSPHEVYDTRWFRCPNCHLRVTEPEKLPENR